MPRARVHNNPERSDDRPPASIAMRSGAGSNVPGGNALQKELCRVGFWNLSGREVTLTIAGKSWNVPKDQEITLDLDRHFAWQVDQRPQHVERIPEGQSTH